MTYEIGFYVLKNRLFGVERALSMSELSISPKQQFFLSGSRSYLVASTRRNTFISRSVLGLEATHGAGLILVGKL